MHRTNRDQLIKPANGHNKVTTKTKVTKERVVLNNWTSPLRKFLEQQSVQDT